MAVSSSSPMFSSWRRTWASAVALMSLVGCFRSLNLDVPNMVCQTNENCPTGLVCVSEKGVGRCRQSGEPDGGYGDGLVGTDLGPILDVQLGTDRTPSLDSLSMDGSNSSQSDATADVPPSVDQGSGSGLDGPAPEVQDAPTLTDLSLPTDGKVIDSSSGTPVDLGNDLPVEPADGKVDRTGDAATPDTPRPPVCGNGVVEQGEQCDDGNTFTETCTYGLASCMVCDGSCQSIAGATSSCGDGKVDSAHEQCDDGNVVTETCAYGRTSCTVCNSTCQSVAGATSYCGDRKVDAANEQCDDGNTVVESCTYGVASCTVCNGACKSVPGATSYCGDAKIDAAREQCDDGNTVTETCAYGRTS